MTNSYKELTWIVEAGLLWYLKLLSSDHKDPHKSAKWWLEIWACHKFGEAANINSDYFAWFAESITVEMIQP